MADIRSGGRTCHACSFYHASLERKNRIIISRFLRSSPLAMHAQSSKPSRRCLMLEAVRHESHLAQTEPPFISEESGLWENYSLTGLEC